MLPYYIYLKRRHVLVEQTKTSSQEPLECEINSTRQTFVLGFHWV